MAHAYHAFTKAPSPGAPLIFAFHGTGGNEFQFNELIEQIRPDAGIVAPRGDVSEHGALRFFRRTGEGVYDMDDLEMRTTRMAAFIAECKAENPGHPVFALGYSNGANILASVLFRQPDLFDKVALLHPLIPWKPDAQEGLKDKEILITAGERDPICPLPLTEQLVSYFDRQGSRVETAYHPGGHEIRQGELQALAQFLAASA
ncbi:alpha/beta hydrolase [Rhizobium sp. C4]|uniref:alpha/beta hydrolase n=1 Tax=Rhizobium sp. C4 TaxID=1349800 RepID=UPI001E52D4AC|nr:alpha/beta hydrolase [Rhizobium sp. C4]MCD2174421.1 alpha/beta hydrolase [Rhizobium sp. C4]